MKVFYRSFGKRIFDLLGSIVLIVLLAPVMVLCAFAILIEDGKPVLFRQERGGLRGQYFLILKFRSMQVMQPGNSSDVFQPGNQSRVTKVGKLLRRTKMDELPQLFNVLVGEMSLVGPRPEVRQWIDGNSEQWQLVLSVRPGITDEASISMRNEEEKLSASDNPEHLYASEILPLKLKYSSAYASDHSFFGDLLVIFRTAYTVLFK